MQHPVIRLEDHDMSELAIYRTRMRLTQACPRYPESVPPDITLRKLEIDFVQEHNMALTGRYVSEVATLM
jgi:hypothetical protein